MAWGRWVLLPSFPPLDAPSRCWTNPLLQGLALVQAALLVLLGC